jgi:hypothetical protein
MCYVISGGGAFLCAVAGVFQCAGTDFTDRLQIDMPVSVVLNGFGAIRQVSVLWGAFHE